MTGSMTRRLAVLALILVGFLALRTWAVLQAQDTPAPTFTPGPPTTAGPVPTSAAPLPTTTIRCRAEVGSLPPMLASDPCPDAEFAVAAAVAQVRLPAASTVIEPGPFYCDVIWPGVRSPPACYGPIVRPGQFMHAWVSFVGSDEVAAVMLGLDLPDDLDQPGATRPPWHATLVATEIPPAGWVMP